MAFASRPQPAEDHRGRNSNHKNAKAIRSHKAECYDDAQDDNNVVIFFLLVCIFYLETFIYAASHEDQLTFRESCLLRAGSYNRPPKRALQYAVKHSFRFSYAKVLGTYELDRSL